jgi:hypothetical protein
MAGLILNRPSNPVNRQAIEHYDKVGLLDQLLSLSGLDALMHHTPLALHLLEQSL